MVLLILTTVSSPHWPAGNMSTISLMSLMVRSTSGMRINKKGMCIRMTYHLTELHHKVTYIHLLTHTSHCMTGGGGGGAYSTCVL